MTLNLDNPILKDSGLPYDLPAWEEIRPKHVVPAVEVAMAHQREAWEAIATNPDPATVENTIEALEISDRMLSRATNIVFTLISSIGGPELEAAEAELGPKLSAHHNAYRLDKRIYDRLCQLDPATLSAEAAYMVAEEIKRFKQGGIELNEADMDRLRAIDAELSAAEITFGQRVIQAMTDNELIVEDEAALAGLSPAQLDSYRQEDGTYRLPLENFTNQPLQTELTNPATRRALLDASLSRGLGGHETSDTRALIIKIAKLRAERAALLGYQFHAQAVAEREMAQSAEAITDLLGTVAAKAVAAVEKERSTLEKMATEDPAGDGLQAGDWRYYQEKLRSEVSVADATLKPYFELNNVVEKGIFFAANKLYGLTFEPRPELAGYVPTMQTWEVKDEAGNGIALFQADFFRRQGKSGGAWMHEVVAGNRFANQRPVIMNNCNFVEPADGEPCLLTWDNVITVFHEFGHALHGILSDTQYAYTSGTSVPRDFVELPSQFNEFWAWHPQVLANFAIHVETGEPLPEELLDKLVAGKTFGQAFDTTEFVAAALLDQAWHRRSLADLPTEPEQVESFEEQALAEFGVAVDVVPPRYRSAYFNHTFGGGYDAGYYSYMWAEVLVAEMEKWFVAQAPADGGLNREVGRKFVTELLSKGGSRAPMESFVAVVGHEPQSEALLERRGLA